MFNFKKASSHRLFLLSLSTVALSLLLGLTSCKGKQIEDENPEKQPEPITAAQSDQFNALVDGLGRPEQIVRVMKSVEAGWGTTDATTNSIITALNAKGCNVSFSTELDALSSFKRTLQVTGTECPLQLHYELSQSKTSRAYSFLASFLFTDETLAQANKIRGGTISWNGKISVTSSGKEINYRWNISGGGNLTLTEGNKEVKFLSSINMAESNGPNGARRNGTYRFDFSNLETPLSLVGELFLTASQDLSKHRINGTSISKSAFETYLDKFGFISGMDAFNEGN